MEEAIAETGLILGTSRGYHSVRCPLIIAIAAALVAVMACLAIAIWDPWFTVLIFAAGALVGGALLGATRGAALGPIAALATALVDLGRDDPLTSVPAWAILLLWLAFAVPGIALAPLGAALARAGRRPPSPTP